MFACHPNIEHFASYFYRILSKFVCILWFLHEKKKIKPTNGIIGYLIIYLMCLRKISFILIARFLNLCVADFLQNNSSHASNDTAEIYCC